MEENTRTGKQQDGHTQNCSCSVRGLDVGRADVAGRGEPGGLLQDSLAARGRERMAVTCPHRARCGSVCDRSQVLRPADKAGMYRWPQCASRESGLRALGEVKCLPEATLVGSKTATSSPCLAVMQLFLPSPPPHPRLRLLTWGPQQHFKGRENSPSLGGGGGEQGDGSGRELAECWAGWVSCYRNHRGGTIAQIH